MSVVLLLFELLYWIMLGIVISMFIVSVVL